MNMARMPSTKWRNLNAPNLLICSAAFLPSVGDSGSFEKNITRNAMKKMAMAM